MLEEYKYKRIYELYELARDLVMIPSLDNGDKIYLALSAERDALKNFIICTHTGNRGYEIRNLGVELESTWKAIEHHIKILGSLYAPKAG